MSKPLSRQLKSFKTTILFIHGLSDCLDNDKKDYMLPLSAGYQKCIIYKVLVFIA